MCWRQLSAGLQEPNAAFRRTQVWHTLKCDYTRHGAAQFALRKYSFCAHNAASTRARTVSAVYYVINFPTAGAQRPWA